MDWSGARGCASAGVYVSIEGVRGACWGQRAGLTIAGTARERQERDEAHPLSS